MGYEIKINIFCKKQKTEIIDDDGGIIKCIEKGVYNYNRIFLVVILIFFLTKTLKKIVT